jgi:hypothetical protein
VNVPCSQISFLPTRVTFTNTGTTPLRLEWSSFDCARRTYAVLAPGDHVTITTWVGHAWGYVDVSTGRTVGGAVIGRGQQSASMP